MLDAARDPGRRAEPARCAVPVAHHQRRGGVGLLRRRHGAVPHQRRDRVRPRALPQRHRRRRLPRPRGRRDPGRDGSAVRTTSGSTRPTASGTFHIHGVTGPDEYTTVVNDNLYTNVMARFTCATPPASVAFLREWNPDAYRSARTPHRPRPTTRSPPGTAPATRCSSRTTTTSASIPRTRASSSASGGTSSGTPPDHYPLLLHFHPLVIYRHQVLKQADVVLAMFLRSRALRPEQKRRNFDYYDPITTGDSSLSACVQSIVAAEVGHDDLAFDYFDQSLYLDLADTHGNTVDGAHIANAAVCGALVHGFAGMVDTGDHLEFRPRIPESWTVDVPAAPPRPTLRVDLDPEGGSLSVVDGLRRRSTMATTGSSSPRRTPRTSSVRTDPASREGASPTWDPPRVVPPNSPDGVARSRILPRPCNDSPNPVSSFSWSAYTFTASTCGDDGTGRVRRHHRPRRIRPGRARRPRMRTRTTRPNLIARCPPTPIRATPSPRRPIPNPPPRRCPRRPHPGVDHGACPRHGVGGQRFRARRGRAGYSGDWAGDAGPSPPHRPGRTLPPTGGTWRRCGNHGTRPGPTRWRYGSSDSSCVRCCPVVATTWTTRRR